MITTAHHCQRYLVPALLAALVLSAVTTNAAPRDLVVVRPGGPRPSEEAQRQVSRLIEEIADRAGWEAASVRAFYFNSSEEALRCIKDDLPGFLLSTPGFFLANREALGLEAVNQLLIDGRDTHRYCVVARKGTIKDVGALAGGSLMGSALAEPDFVERVVLTHRLDFATEVDASYRRGLSALRALSRGEVQAVVVDEIEQAGLGSLPFADDLETIFCSEPIPNTGIFALSGVATDADAAALAKATDEFCTAGEGAEICETYQISGFQEIAATTFDGLIQVYEGTSGSP